VSECFATGAPAFYQPLNLPLGSCTKDPRRIVKIADFFSKVVIGCRFASNGRYKLGYFPIMRPTCAHFDQAYSVDQFSL
jgi:hypothetical protein